ncbi:MAG TPA: hypothetical protein VFP58_04915 [Candidatus Eisenbacteria bacterium]|nr:hypothetical protein [Candidatus Eisenbacteria bacterium]
MFSFLLTVALFLVPVLASAQVWVPVGVPGGNVRELAEDPRNPDRLYLGTADGILYRSEDGGLNWARLSPGFPRRGCSLDEIVVDRSGVVYVGFWEVHGGGGGGVAWSSDRGETFHLLKGIEGRSVRALAISPTNRRVLAAGALDGVYLSSNAGKSWARITPEGHRQLRNFGSVAFDPTDPRVIYAGTWHLAWKTVDGGAHWTRMDRGMIDDSDVMTLTIDPGSAQTVYATACTGIYRSTNAGDQWTKLKGIPFSARRTRSFALGRDDQDLLLAGTTQGLWMSPDGGATWRRATKKLVINAVVARPDGSILVGTEEEGILRSKDGGQTWILSNTGFSERMVANLLFDPPRNRVLMAAWGARGGVYSATNVGGPWTRLSEGIEDRQALSLALYGRTVLAGTDEGIYARPAGSRTWIPCPIHVDGAEVRARVTQLHTLASGDLVAGTSAGLFRSSDGGVTWSRPGSGGGQEVLGLAVSARNPNLLVSATRSGFFRSRDGGVTWGQVSKPLGVTPHNLAFLPLDDRVLFATTTGGLYQSKDQGTKWKRVNGGIPHSDLTGIVIHPEGRSIHVSDFTWGGIFRSTDGGSTWERMPTDGLGSDRVWALNADPSDPDRLLASASAGGLHLFLPRNAAPAARAENELAPVADEE